MVLMVVAGTRLFFLYRDIYGSNVQLEGEQKVYLHVASGSSMDDVISLLVENGWIKRERGLRWVMKKKHYSQHIHTGRYELHNGMNNNTLVNLLRSGMQTPLNLTFNNIRVVEEFAGKISHQIQLDSVTLITHLRDTAFLRPYGFNPKTVIGMFIPNTYQVYWDMDIRAFFSRMNKEYLAFWNVSRLKKAQAMNLTPIQVCVLASIVDEETIKQDEKPMVAGVYVNRLKRKIPLQADPTLKFALGDFTIRRIHNKDKRINSPYNTYKYRGLPPGPIRQPSVSGINAVLNYTRHRYIYFCANPDFSGYHLFARTLTEHNRNARRYQRALSKEGIFR